MSSCRCKLDLHSDLPCGFHAVSTFIALILRVKVDNYSLHAASAIAGVSSFRAFAGFGFPLFADSMYRSLGDGTFSSAFKEQKPFL